MILNNRVTPRKAFAIEALRQPNRRANVCFAIFGLITQNENADCCNRHHQTSLPNFPKTIHNMLSSRETFYDERVSTSVGLKRQRICVANEERVNVVRLLEDRLEDHTKSLKDTQKAARCLEELLFRSAPSIATYQDLSTLENRVSAILTVQVQRRLHKSCKKNRSCHLRKTMGKELYTQAQQLVQEIQLCKNQKVASMKCHGGTCSRPFRDSFPPAVRHLFFETELINAFQKSPLERIPFYDWKQLIQDAQENLQAYRKCGY